MNKRLGLYSANVMLIVTVLFAFGLIIDNSKLSFSVCLILSWAYLLVVSAFATEVTDDRKALAYGALLFALLYACFINLVYFTQLTTVAYMSAAPEILDMLSYESLGSLFFNINLLGYGFMALSSCLIGIALLPTNKNDRVLKNLLIFHVLAFPGIFLPMFNIFNGNMGSAGDIIGVIILLIWCAYFIPVGAYSIIHFKNK